MKCSGFTFSTILPLQKAEFSRITEVQQHRSFSQESNSLGASAALQLSLCFSENSRLWSSYRVPCSAFCPFDFLTDIWKHNYRQYAQALLGHPCSFGILKHMRTQQVLIFLESELEVSLHIFEVWENFGSYLKQITQAGALGFLQEL